eukprot:43571-Eustigmatos_ZCMA.PRE.1
MIADHKWTELNSMLHSLNGGVDLATLQNAREDTTHTQIKALQDAMRKMKASSDPDCQLRFLRESVLPIIKTQALAFLVMVER